MTLLKYDYELALCSKISTGYPETNTVHFESANNELFILRNYPCLLNSSSFPYYQIYNEDLYIQSKVTPLILQKEVMSSLPEIIGATKDTLFILVNRGVSASIRLVNRETGIEASRLENFRFERYTCFRLTREYEPKIVAAKVRQVRKSMRALMFPKSVTVYQVGLFSASNGAALGEVSFETKPKDSSDERHDGEFLQHKVHLLPNGYFGYFNERSGKCYFF
jgi:hypothetical protein